MTTPGKVAKGRDTLSKMQRKWSKPLIAAGWTAIPSVLLERQHKLGLDSVELNIILHIVKHWWDPENLPYPAKGSIARAMRVSPRTVQRHLHALE